MGRTIGDLTVKFGADTIPLEKGLAEGEKLYNAASKRLGRLQQAQQLTMQSMLLKIDSTVADGYKTFIASSISGLDAQINTQQQRVKVLTERLEAASKKAPGSDTESRANLALAQSEFTLSKLQAARVQVLKQQTQESEKLFQVDLARNTLAQKVTTAKTDSTLARQMAENASASDLFQTKLRGLSETIVLQRQKSEILNKAYKESVRLYGEGSEQALKYREAIFSNTSALYNSIKKLNDTSKEATASGFRLTEVFKSAMFMTAVSGLMALSAALATAGKNSLSLAVKAVESENLFNVATEKNAGSIRAWSESVSTSLGLNAYQLRKDAGTWYIMFSAMGMGSEKAKEMSTNLTQLAYDIASLYNIPVEDAFLKLRSGLTGELEPLRRLGILVDVNTVNQTAWREGIAATGAELTAQEKIQSRYATILSQTTAAQGDLARTMNDPANQARRLKAQIEELEIEIGQNLLPIYKEFLRILNDITSKQGSSDNKGRQAFTTSAGLTAAGAALGGMVAGPKGALVGAGVGAIAGSALALKGAVDASKQAEKDNKKVWNNVLNTEISFSERRLAYQKEYNEEFQKEEDKRKQQFIQRYGNLTGYKASEPATIKDDIARDRWRRETDKEYDANKKKDEETVLAATLAQERAREWEAQQAAALERQKMRVKLYQADNQGLMASMEQINVQSQEFRKNKLGEKDIQEYVDKAKLNSINQVIQAEREVQANLTSLYTSDIDSKMIAVQNKIIGLRGQGVSDNTIRQALIVEKEKMVRDIVKIEHTMSDRIAEIDGDTLQGQIRNIKNQAEAYRKAGVDRLQIDRWVAKEREALEANAAKSTPYYSAIYNALKNKTSISDAISEVEKDKELQKQALELSKAYIPKTTEPRTTEEDAKSAYIKSIEDAFASIDWQTLGTSAANMFFGTWSKRVKDLQAEFANIGKPPSPNQSGGSSGRGNYNPGSQYAMLDKNYNVTAYITVPVAIDGQQVGEAAAKVLLPPIEQALGGDTSTRYSGR